MALKRCGFCLHWQPRDTTDPDREVASAITGQITGVCLRITDSSGSAEAYPLAALVAWDAEPKLVTSPDFGCAAFERKAEPPSAAITWSLPTKP